MINRRGRFIIGSLFITLVFGYGGGFNTVPVFIPALIKHYGWSRTQVSLLPSVVSVSAGLSALLVGRLLDRFEARLIMAAGLGMAGLAFIAASTMHSFAPMVAAYLLLGVGISAGTLVPASFVVANWFGVSQRGIALGMVMTGTTIGAMAMTQVASYAVIHSGLRAAYLLMGAPMILIAIPVILLVVRSRPPGVVKLTVAEAGDLLEGFEVAQALRTRSFWLIMYGFFAYFFGASGAIFHMVAALIDLGYKAQTGAWVLTGCFGFASLGKILLGMVADRSSGRTGLAINFAGQAIGVTLALFLFHAPLIALFMIFFGMTQGAPIVLIPVMIAESLGLKRYGSISGMVSVAGTVGAALGPLSAGVIHDMTNSYASSYELFLVTNLLGVAASLSCLPYKTELVRMNAEVPALA
jgi:sugar phosphate permease